MQEVEPEDNTTKNKQKQGVCDHSLFFIFYSPQVHYIFKLEASNNNLTLEAYLGYGVSDRAVTVDSRLFEVNKILRILLLHPYNLV